MLLQPTAGDMINLQQEINQSAVSKWNQRMRKAVDECGRLTCMSYERMSRSIVENRWDG